MELDAFMNCTDLHVRVIELNTITPMRTDFDPLPICCSDPQSGQPHDTGAALLPSRPLAAQRADTDHRWDTDHCGQRGGGPVQRGADLAGAPPRHDHHCRQQRPDF